MTMAYTNDVVAGYRGADTFARAPQSQNYMVASARGIPAPGPDGTIADGRGAPGVNGMGSGGSGGRLPDPETGRFERPAQDGAPMVVADIPTGQPGRGGPRDGGGGGGASYGSGGNGKTIVAGGDFQSGAKGGDGFVKLRPIQIAQATPAPVVAPAAAPAPAPYVAPRRRDRN
jgi:hypothetical protein